MPCTSAAQKQQASAPAEDMTFTKDFYAPYEAAAHSALRLIARARGELAARMPGEDVCAVTYRLKTPQSIRGKLEKKGLPSSTGAAGAALRDIAGLRVVLSSVRAVYLFADLLAQSPSAQHIGLHDYIANPKQSGYRSLHVLLRIPAVVGGQSLTVPVEIQLRTVPMDLWATIEHGIYYKPQRE